MAVRVLAPASPLHERPRRPVDVLRRFVLPRAAAPSEERCDLCATPVSERHAHLVDLEHRRLVCACSPCALLFDQRDAIVRFKRVPAERRRVRDLRLGGDFWERLQIPVRLAFFFESSGSERVVAFYPGPSGATESLLSLEAWQEVVADNPVLGTLQSDVEAILLRDSEGREPECYLVPIDACYALTGTVRRSWKGFHGGAEAWRDIDRFFEVLRDEAREISRSGVS